MLSVLESLINIRDDTTPYNYLVIYRVQDLCSCDDLSFCDTYLGKTFITFFFTG